MSEKKIYTNSFIEFPGDSIDIMFTDEAKHYINNMIICGSLDKEDISVEIRLKVNNNRAEELSNICNKIISKNTEETFTIGSMCYSDNDTNSLDNDILSLKDKVQENTNLLEQIGVGKGTIEVVNLIKKEFPDYSDKVIYSLVIQLLYVDSPPIQ